MQAIDVTVTGKGQVPDSARRYAADKVGRVSRFAPRPVLFARVTLTEEQNRAVERRAEAKASLDVSGRLVRAHVAAKTMREAVDLLEERLRRGLEILAEHREARRSEPATTEPGEWRHGSLPSERPPFFPRPAEEREIVRRKTYAPEPVSPAEAAFDLELLDHDFHLFTNDETGREAVLHRTPDGAVELVEQGPLETVEQAVERLTASGAPFVFFVERESGRGNLLYVRYDGHYGLVAPQDGS